MRKIIKRIKIGFWTCLIGMAPRYFMRCYEKRGDDLARSCQRFTTLCDKQKADGLTFVEGAEFRKIKNSFEDVLKKEGLL